MFHTIDDILLGQDGSAVQKELKDKFGLIQGLDTRFKQKRIDSEVYDFVGLVCQKDALLVVFPKHYFPDDLLDPKAPKIDLDKDIQLLFDVIQKYITNQNPSASKYAGSQITFESDFPFAAFFSIYNYFQQFGIYQEKVSRTKVSQSGKVSWKETIRKANKIYSAGNIIHFPIYRKESKSKQVFISDCMAFAIDYTLSRFPFLFSLPNTNHKPSNFDFFGNVEYVISHLQHYRNNVFKDMNKRLIQDLIDFFSDLEEHFKGGDIHVKIKYFNLVWEEMVGNYLNSHFVEADTVNQKLIFDHEKLQSRIKFTKKTFQVDKSDNKFTIEPDHYFIDENLQYIFDAKYYGNLDQLNYKQYSYHEMLKNKKEDNNTISALLVPSEIDNCSEIHLSIADEFIQQGTIGTTIISQKLKIKDVMKSYINSENL